MLNDKDNNIEQNDTGKDLQFEGDEYKNMEGENHSTAAEGELAEDDKNKNQENTFKGNEEHSDDNAVGQKKQAEKEAMTDSTRRTTLAEDESIDKDQEAG